MGHNRPYKYDIKCISKTLVNIDTKHITNAITVSDILAEQLGYDIK